MVLFEPRAVALPTRDAQVALLLVLFIGMVPLSKARVSVGVDRWPRGPTRHVQGILGYHKPSKGIHLYVANLVRRVERGVDREKRRKKTSWRVGETVDAGNMSDVRCTQWCGGWKDRPMPM